MPATALSFSLVLGLSACGPRLADRNIDAVNRLYEQAEKSGKEVTIKEVESVLGQPTRMETYPIEMQRTRELPIVRYYYQENGRTIVLHFVDNKLSKHVDHFGETPAPEESEQRRMVPRPSPAKRTEKAPVESERPAPPPPSQPN
ncbi:MAG: hypothetical protein ABJF10_29525 [Chthoniobacter sp.]|uniref:hypothetical protein n=1 Tax=Chthoniobacter sp. TaxID=2510640 RepID=UPI0032A98B47